MNPVRFIRSHISVKEFSILITLSLLGSHFMEMLGRDESLGQVLQAKYYYIDVGSGMVLALLGLTIVWVATSELERRTDWKTQLLKRALMQLFFWCSVTDDCALFWDLFTSSFTDPR